MTDGAHLPHEKLEVYRVALQLHATAAAALPRTGSRELRSQLERASTSVVLNIAEGAGRTAAPDKRRFYEIAKGSATECAAIIDLLRTTRGSDLTRCAQARELAIRVNQMLSRLASPPR